MTNSKILLPHRLKRMVSQIGSFQFSIRKVYDGENVTGCKGEIVSLKKKSSLFFDTSSIVKGPFYGRIKCYLNGNSDNVQYLSEEEFFDLIEKIK